MSWEEETFCLSRIYTVVTIPVRFYLLGRLHVEVRGTVQARFYSQKAALLLARLALAPNREFGREELIEWLWPDAEFELGRTSLRTVLSALRRMLAGESDTPQTILQTSRQRIGLNATQYSTDVADFENRVKAIAQITERRSRSQAFDQALSHYGGEFLPGFYDDWVLQERERLHKLYQQTAYAQIRQREQDGDLESALQLAQHLSRQDILQGNTQRLLLRLLVENGQVDQAKMQYAHYCQQLQEKFALPLDTEMLHFARRYQLLDTPSSSTKQNKTKHWELVDNSAVTMRSPSLPLPRDRYIPREPEYLQLTNLLTKSRLVTVTGAGGVGKTRFVLETLQKTALQTPFTFLALTDTHSPTQIPEIILRGLNLPRNPRLSAEDQVFIALKAKPLLLVLDNCEQLLPTMSAWVLTLLSTLPELQLLLTSQRKLNVPEEATIELKPLAFPPYIQETITEDLRSYPSVELFLDRAHSVKGAIEWTPHNQRAVARLCTRLEGLPLALELAAVRCTVMTPAQIEVALSDPWYLLVTRHPSTDSRHNSLRETIQWSYSLLSPNTQHFLIQISLFQGGFTLEAALALTEKAPDQIAELLDVSLLRQEYNGETNRFYLLETIRQFAALQYSEIDPDKHAQNQLVQFFLTLAEKQNARLEGPDATQALDILQQEEGNFQAILVFCATEPKRITTGLQLCSTLGRFWLLRARLVEGEEWLQKFLQATTTDDASHARGLRELGVLAWGQGKWQLATDSLEISIRFYQQQEDAMGKAQCLLLIGQVRHGQGDFAESDRFVEQAIEIFKQNKEALGEANALHLMANNAASQGKSEADVRPLYEQTIAIYRQLKNPARLGFALTHLGVFYLSLERYPVAKRLHEEAIDLLRQTDSRRGLAYALNSYGSILRAVQETEAALLAYQESLKLFRAMGERQGTASVLGFLGTLQLRNSPQETIPLFRESLLLWRELDLSFKPGVLIALYALSYVFYQIGDPEQSATLFGAADNLYQKQCAEIHSKMIEESYFFTWRDEAQKNIPPETWTPRYESGKCLDWSEAVTFALQ